MKSILLITSQPSIRADFTGMLQPFYRVLCASEEDEGLRELKQNPADIVAVLIELAMARQSGFAFAERMREVSTFSPIPLIAISAALPVPEDMDCIEHGFHDLITAYAPQQLVYKRIGNAIRASDSLSLSELEKMLKALPSCIFLKDSEGRYVFSTQYWHHLDIQDDPDWSIRGKTDLEVRRDKDNAMKAMEADRRILRTGEGSDYIIEENEDGIREYLQLIKRPVYDEEGRINGIIALINNVTEYQLLKMELEKRAKTDELTGLLNKGAAQDLIRMMMSNYQKEGDRSALLMLDVDYFKQVNDTFGHAEGDRVLSEIGRIIKNGCRAMDVAGRIGGDEFLIYMRDILSPDNAVQLARRLQDQTARAFADSALEGRVSLSIGIALYPEHGHRFDDLFKAADKALYYVKKHGRAAFRVAPTGEGD